MQSFSCPPLRRPSTCHRLCFLLPLPLVHLCLSPDADTHKHNCIPLHAIHTHTAHCCSLLHTRLFSQPLFFFGFSFFCGFCFVGILAGDCSVLSSCSYSLWRSLGRASPAALHSWSTRALHSTPLRSTFPTPRTLAFRYAKGTRFALPFSFLPFLFFLVCLLSQAPPPPFPGAFRLCLSHSQARCCVAA